MWGARGPALVWPLTLTSLRLDQIDIRKVITANLQSVLSQLEYP